MSEKNLNNILQLASKEAESYGGSVITSEHLVLTFLRGQDGCAVKILRHLNVPVEEIAAEIEEHLRLTAMSEQEVATVFKADKEYPYPVLPCVIYVWP